MVFDQRFDHRAYISLYMYNEKSKLDWTERLGSDQKRASSGLVVDCNHFNSPSFPVVKEKPQWP